MANKFFKEEPKPIPLSTPATPSKKLEELPSPAPFDDKPLVKSIGLAKVRGGWCVVEVHSQGNNIVETDVVSGPDPKHVAMDQLKIAVVRRLLAPEVGN